jgi:ribonuclease HIII
MNYVLELTLEQIEEVITYYEPIAESVFLENTMAAFEGNHVTISIYPSKKVMFQGKKAKSQYDLWASKFHINVEEAPVETVKKSSTFYEPSIGSDESGSGDYFGPLCVAAVYINQNDEEFLKSLTVKDSKLLDDATIIEVVPKIIERIPYSLMVLNNTKYNEMVDKGYNLNALKAYLHAQSHKALSQKVGKKGPIIVDEFVSSKKYYEYIKNLDGVLDVQTFVTKAETHYASVAVASMIARYAFLSHMQKLSKKVKLSLQKGASPLVDDQAAFIIKTHGERLLKDVAKVHFANTLKAKALIK